MVRAITRLIGKRHPHNFGRRRVVRRQDKWREAQSRGARRTAASGLGALICLAPTLSTAVETFAQVLRCWISARKDRTCHRVAFTSDMCHRGTFHAQTVPDFVLRGSLHDAGAGADPPSDLFCRASPREGERAPG